MGSNCKIHSYDKVHQIGVAKGTNGGNIIAFLTHSSILFHCQIRWPRVDDPACIILGIDEWLSNCLCHDSSSQRLHGTLPWVTRIREWTRTTESFCSYNLHNEGVCLLAGSRAKCIGKFAGLVSSRWNIRRRIAWLVMAYWKIRILKGMKYEVQKNCCAQCAMFVVLFLAMICLLFLVICEVEYFMKLDIVAFDKRGWYVKMN